MFNIFIDNLVNPMHELEFVREISIDEYPYRTEYSGLLQILREVLFFLSGPLYNDCIWLQASGVRPLKTVLTDPCRRATGIK